MASEATQNEAEAAAAASTEPLPQIRIARPHTAIDWATVLGLFFSVGVIFLAIWVGQSNASFFNVPSLLIVVVGTLCATSISYSTDELKRAWSIIAHSMARKVYYPSDLARTLISLSIVARKKGVLALSTYDKELRHDPFLSKAIQMVVDGYTPADIQRLLGQEIEAQIERHKRTASITLRASEVAPAMGLIGTLVGLVQMLADLENPESIGPSMAVALLTTFYGAILGTIVMAPLAVKLKKNSADEAMIKTLITIAALSIANQENPRRLEMLLNSELPPSLRINYFDAR